MLLRPASIVPESVGVYIVRNDQAWSYSPQWSKTDPTKERALSANEDFHPTLHKRSVSQVRLRAFEPLPKATWEVSSNVSVDYGWPSSGC